MFLVCIWSWFKRIQIAFMTGAEESGLLAGAALITLNCTLLHRAACNGGDVCTADAEIVQLTIAEAGQLVIS